MDESTRSYSDKELESMNDRSLQNQFFTPDHVYLDLALLKDFPIGAVYADQLRKSSSKQEFETVQQKIMNCLSDYQKRIYDSVNPFFGDFGYTDEVLDRIFADSSLHRQIFLMSPATHFFGTIIAHTYRNQNNSRPANKYTKIAIDKKKYSVQAIPVTYYINTYPLTLSYPILESLGKELGEAFGVNIRFLNKDPDLFDGSDWDDWLGKIDCFYVNDLGRFTGSDLIVEKAHAMDLSNCYLFARKRFQKEYMKAMQGHDIEKELQVLYARCSMLFDFTWLQNNEVRLTNDQEHNPEGETVSI